MMVLNAPRIFATAYDSFFVHLHKADDSFGSGQLAAGSLAGLQTIILTLPALGFVYSSTRAGGKAFGGAWRWSDGAPMRRFSVLGATAGVIAFLGFIWWPNGDYKPIQPAESGTVQGAISQLKSVPTGRPGLTHERQHQLGGAPTVSDQSLPGDTGGKSPGSQTTGPSGTTEPTTTEESGTTDVGTTTTEPTTTTTTTTTP
jgi:hypothetical protein